MQHASDCSRHNMPALPMMPCDCGAAKAGVNELSALSAIPPGVSMADMANPPRTIQTLRQRIAKLESELEAERKQKPAPSFPGAGTPQQ